MTRPLQWHQVLAVSHRVNWCLEDLVGEVRRLDFSRPFLPETLVWARPLSFLSAHEQLLLNHIRTRGYLALFELVESFVVPFMAQQADGEPPESDSAPALRNFILEEEKHRRLFTEVLRHFDAQFAARCDFIGPADAIRHEVLRHSPLAVTIATLGLEWMSQGHYLESVRDDQQLDPPFKSLLRHHWVEEAQHAELDNLLLNRLACQVPATEIDAAVEEYFQIGAFLDGGLQQLAGFDLEALQCAAGRRFAAPERQEFLRVQHRAQRWTFLGCAMGNPNFQRALAGVSEAAARRVAQAAATFSLH